MFQDNLVRHSFYLSSYRIYKKTNEINLKPPNFGPNLVPIVPSYDSIQFQGELMNQTWEDGKKPSFKPDFGHFGQN